MSWKASSTAKELTKGIHGEKLSMADKLVLMILSENYLEDKGFVWCSQKLLSKHCVCSERGLRGILERLERFGLVGIAHRAKLGNYYTLIFMRNHVPQKQIFYEEPHAVSEEAGALCEERGAVSEEQAVPPERLTVSKTVDGVAPSAPLAPEICPEHQVLKDLCRGKHRPERPSKQKQKSYRPRTVYTREEVAHVESKRKRPTAEELGRIARDRAQVFFDPSRVDPSVRRIFAPRPPK